MNEWLLMVIITVGVKGGFAVDQISVNRFPTQQACEVQGAAEKRQIKKKNLAFTCFEVTKVK